MSRARARLAILLLALVAAGCATARTETPYTPGSLPTAPLPDPFPYSHEVPPVANRNEGDIDAHVVRLLRFPSVGENGQPGNMVTVRYYERRAPGRRPLVVILPIWGGHTYPPGIVAADLLRAGEVQVMQVLGPEMVVDWDTLAAAPDAGAFRAEVGRVAERVRATIIDLRRLLDWAETRPAIDARRVAMVGFSESTLQVAGIMASDERLAAAVLIMGGAHPHEVLATCYGPPADMRDRILPRLGWTPAQLAAATEPVLRPVDPARLGSRLRPERVLIFDAEEDDCIPASARQALWEAAGRPARVSIDATHAGAFLAMTFLGGNHIRHRIMEFLKQALPVDPKAP